MNSSRSDTDFCLRYAVRVLERYARLWHRVDATARLLALISGTSAFGALMAQSPRWTITAGLFFAFLQAVEYTLTPARRENEARTARALYLEVLAKQHQLDESDYDAAYLEACARDPIIVPASLKHLAYNDIAEENGARHELYKLTRWQSIVDWVA